MLKPNRARIWSFFLREINSNLHEFKTVVAYFLITKTSADLDRRNCFRCLCVLPSLVVRPHVLCLTFPSGRRLAAKGTTVGGVDVHKDLSYL